MQLAALNEYCNVKLAGFSKTVKALNTLAILDGSVSQYYNWPVAEAGEELVVDTFRCQRDSQSVMEWRRVSPDLTSSGNRGEVSLAKSRATEIRKKGLR